MTAKAMIRRVREAVKEVRAMGGQGFVSMEECRGASRKAAAEVLHQQMGARVSAHLERCAKERLEDRRNGSYARRLLTEVGDLELSVPRTRYYAPVEVVRAYARRSATLDQLILGCFLFGLSTRKVSKVLVRALGTAISSATVSAVAKILDGAVEAYHRRPLQDRYRVLMLDGVVLARKTGTGAVRRPVLVALGILPDGRKEVLDFRMAQGESQAAWEAFLNDLHRRGLTGASLELVGVDGGKGLLAALPLVYPHVPVQRCWAHKSRNIINKCRKADRLEVKRDLHKVMHAAGLVQARSAARRFSAHWGTLYPEAVACLTADLDALLTFLRFDDPVWRKRVRTTNAIERRFVEVRRRTRPMGVFFDTTSIERILYAVFTNENENQGITALFPVTHNS
jgi:putative transposase